MDTLWTKFSLNCVIKLFRPRKKRQKYYSHHYFFSLIYLLPILLHRFLVCFANFDFSNHFMCQHCPLVICTGSLFLYKFIERKYLYVRLTIHIIQAAMVYRFIFESYLFIGIMGSDTLHKFSLYTNSMYSFGCFVRIKCPYAISDNQSNEHLAGIFMHSEINFYTSRSEGHSGQLVIQTKILRSDHSRYFCRFLKVNKIQPSLSHVIAFIEIHNLKIEKRKNCANDSKLCTGDTITTQNFILLFQLNVDGTFSLDTTGGSKEFVCRFVCVFSVSPTQEKLLKDPFFY